VNTNIEGKKDTRMMVLDDVVEMMKLIKDDKKFLEMKQQQYAKEFLEKFTDNDFTNILRTSINQTKSINHSFC
jgi:hypothetical protein